MKHFEPGQFVYAARPSGVDMYKYKCATYDGKHALIHKYGGICYVVDRDVYAAHADAVTRAIQQIDTRIENLRKRREKLAAIVCLNDAEGLLV